MGHKIELISKLVLENLIKSKSTFTGLVSKPIRVYNIDDFLTQSEIEKVRLLLSDPVVDFFSVDSSLINNNPPINNLLGGPSVLTNGGSSKYHQIKKSPKPGVTDPEGRETQKAIERLLGRNIGCVSFSQQYIWIGELDSKRYLQLIKELGNSLIYDFRLIDNSFLNDEYKRNCPSSIGIPKPLAPTNFGYLDINLDDQGLLRVSEDRLLALNLLEMQTIRKLFSDPAYLSKRKEAGLEHFITDAELESIAQSWSEHCIHKKFNAIWEYESDDPEDRSGLGSTIDSLFKSIIKKNTDDISKKVGWLLSVFEDNAGVIKLNDNWTIAHKVETHNFPSTLDPFGGANTGSGGVFRDPKSTGIGMKVISSQYGFRIANPDSYKNLPPEIIPAEKILQGVVAGVEDYGNKMGIPTACGNVFVDDGWLKCAVYVGAVAIAPLKTGNSFTYQKEVKPDYIALNLGGKVGKDGIHGATASSLGQNSNAEEDLQVNQAVQIGDPIIEKNVFEVMDVLRDNGFIKAAQDCGAGGWNSAIGELAQLSNGVLMDLSFVPEKYLGLKSWEKLVSEAQEREVIVIKPEDLPRVLDICKHYNVEATKVAVFTDSGFYHVKDQNQTVVYLPLEFLHHGLPRMTIKARWNKKKWADQTVKNSEMETEIIHLNTAAETETLLKLLSQPNLQSYEWISRRYDHEVMGGSLIKPLIGIGGGKSDAVAYYPILGEKLVVIESWGSNPWQGIIDPYEMGRNNVIDAIGKIISVGGNLNKIVFNGNTTCPKPEDDPEIAAGILRMIKGAADAQLYFNAPTISGKDSTSMERSYRSTESGQEIKVKAKLELLMSALSIVEDDSTLITSDFKLPGDIIYIVGETKNELAASEYYLMNFANKDNFTNKIPGSENVPKSNFEEIKTIYEQMIKATKYKLLHSAQYLTKGGLAYALSNSAIAADLGLEVRLDNLFPSQTDKPDQTGNKAINPLLYSESTGRFVISVHPANKNHFEEVMKDSYCKEIGVVNGSKEFKITLDNQSIISTSVDQLREYNKGKIRCEYNQ